MTRPTVRWTRRALSRIRAIDDHLSPRSPAAAAHVIGRIERLVAGIPDHPEWGRKGRVAGTRELILGDLPYIVVYRIQGAFIDVLTVLHGSQRWPDRF